MKKLSEMKPEEEGTVESIEGRFKNRVIGMGIREGKKVRIPAKQPVRGPITVEVEDSTVSLDRRLADKITVEGKK